jgi:outer membrane protein assembly factor BamB
MVGISTLSRKSLPHPLLAALVAVALLSSCGERSEDPGDPALPGVDAYSTRHASGPIDSSTVSTLERAWSVPLTARSVFGSHASSPVVLDGTVYSQDLQSNVQAINLDSGETLWTKAYKSRSVGPNGVVVAGDRVFGATADLVFALDRMTGEAIWSVRLAHDEREGIDMAPGYRDGVVYVSTVPVTTAGIYYAGSIGVLWALDATSGEKLWRFDTVPKGLWGNPEVNSGGGLWYPPSFDDEGFMYFGVGNPAPFPGSGGEPWGSSRPGPNLYTNSMVKLDAETGKMRWYYQQTPHDIYDWDFQDPPVLVDVNGERLAIGAGKAGVVVALDRDTGEPVWSRPVGVHNGHDEDSILAMAGEYDELETPATVLPGQLGGVIAPMASDGSKLFVAVVNGASAVPSGSSITVPKAVSGELVALDLATGAVEWKRELPTAAYGAPLAINDLVFATTYDGQVRAYDTENGQIAWREQLPAGCNAGVMVAGNTVIVSAGVAADEGQAPQLVAYRLR